MISASFRLENRFDAPIMPHLQAEIPPLNFVRAVSTSRCITCFLMICMALSKKVVCLYFSIMANGWEGWLKDAEGQDSADAVLRTASSSLFVIQ